MNRMSQNRFDCQFELTQMISIEPRTTNRISKLRSIPAPIWIVLKIPFATAGLSLLRRLHSTHKAANSMPSIDPTTMSPRSQPNWTRYIHLQRQPTPNPAQHKQPHWKNLSTQPKSLIPTSSSPNSRVASNRSTHLLSPQFQKPTKPYRSMPRSRPIWTRKTASNR